MRSGLAEHGFQTDGISVVMVSFQTGAVLFQAIEAALASADEVLAELILVDNGNPQTITKQLEHLASREARLTLVSGHGNVGFARGCNIGAGRASGRYLVLLNPDCCLAPDTLSALQAEAIKLGDNWMLGCRVLNPDGSDQRGSRRALLTPCTALVETFRFDKLAPRLLHRYRLNQHDNPLPENTTRVPAISGACMMLPATTFHAVNGMDEGYFLHVDDLDLCFRLHKARIPVYYAPHIKSVHYASSSRSNPVIVEWHKTRGFLRYFHIHFHGIRWLPLVASVSLGILIRFGVKAILSMLYGSHKGRTGTHVFRR